MNLNYRSCRTSIPRKRRSNYNNNNNRRACRTAQASAQKRTNWACRKEKGGLSATKGAVGRTPEPPLPEGNKQSHQSRHQIVRWERAIMSESRTLLREREGSDWKHEVERVSFMLKEGVLGRNAGQAKRTFLGAEEESMNG